MSLLTNHGPCGWTLDTTCCPEWATATQAQRDRAQALATEIIWRLSGMRFGLCELTVRPCGSECDEASTYYMAHGTFPAWQPMMLDGAWVNCGGCGCASPCRCCRVCSVVLPAPVHSVTSVTIDGMAVLAAAYRVDDHRELVRIDGGTCWPRCQNLSAGPGEDDTFAVTYLRGTPIPAGGLAAAGAYACELLKACIGGPCRLPQRTQAITREGVTIAIQDSLDFLDKGLIGLPEVDSWLRAVNPGRLAAFSQVYNIDHLPARVQTS